VFRMKKLLLLFYFIFGFTIDALSAAIKYSPPPVTVNTTFTGPSGTVNASPVTVTLTLDKPVLTPLKSTDFTVDNGSIASLSEKVTLSYSSQFGTAGSGNSMLNKPNDVAVNTSGQTFVSDGLNNRIEIFNADGTYGGQFGTAGTGNTQFNQPYGIAFDASGYIYVADMGNNRIQVYDNSFNYIKTIGTSGLGQLSSPKGIYIDASNSLYVADYGNNRVAIFDNTGNYKSQIKNAGAGAGQFLSPAGVTLDAAGAVYITDSENGQVVKFSTAGAYISKIVGLGSGALSSPTGITIDGTGKIYVVDNANQFVEVFSAGGSPLGIIAGSGSANGTFNFPEGITTDNNGNLYVADQINNRVQVLKAKEQYTLSVVPAANGTVTINLPANVNNSGNTAASFSFYYIATPSTPAGLTAISLDKNVELDWTANPTNDNIFSYKIYVRTATDPISLVATVPGSVTTYTAHTPLLINGTTYYYSIVAVNNSGVVSNYSPEVAVVPMASQTITAGTIPDKTYGDPPFSIAGIATASSGLPVTYTIASGLASILADGVTVKINGAGVVHINVNQAGNTTISPAPTYDLQFTVNKATPIITWATPADITYGTAITATQLNAQANVPGTFVYDPTLLSATKYDVGPHALSVTFTPSDQVNYKTATASVNINVKPIDPVINWTVPATVIAKTDVATLENATISSPATIAGNWTYSIPAGTILHTGDNQTLKATFTPIAPDNVNYDAVSKTVTFNVVPITPVITWATPAAITYGTALSITQLNATVNNNIPGTLTYDQHVGQVLNAGLHQPLTVHFVPTDPDYATISQTVYIDVTTATPQIVWAVPAPITYGTALSSTQLNATTVGNVLGTMTYTPDFGAILNASLNQTLTAHFVASDPNYSMAEVTATVNLIVNQATPVITWPTPAEIPYGTAIGAAQLNAEANVPGTFVYDPTLLSATKYNVGPHNLYLTFTPTDQVNYTTATASVTINVKKADPVINWTVGNIDAKTLVSALETATISSPASITGSWSYSLPSATILHIGTGQTLTATFTPTGADADNYNIASKTVTFDVVPITPAITWNTPEAITYGTALSNIQLNATVAGGIAGTPTYNPVVGTVLSAGLNQALTFNFVPTDADYATVSKIVYINVNKAVAQLTWTTPSPITYGTALTTQLDASVVGGVSGNLTYDHQAGDILPGGHRPLTATFVATDPNYSSTPVTLTVYIDVNKISPIITWLTPADIAYGTLLSSVQLNATATQPGTNTVINGTFDYTPAAGGPALSVGAHTLSVVFHPTGADANNYADNATQTTTITVKGADPVINWTVPATVLAKTDVATLENATISSPASIAGNWSYSISAGTILHVGDSQRLTATFTPTGVDANSYNIVSKTVTFNVVPITPLVTWATPAAINYGTALSNTQLNASVNNGIAGTPTYNPIEGTILSAGQNQPLKFNFVPTDLDYAMVSQTVYINVNAATPQIVWALPEAITYGTILSNAQLNATTVGGVKGTMSYSPDAGKILNAGMQTLTAYFVASDPNYNSNRITATVSLVVNKAKPTITWPNPANISYGTLLSNVQLNAKATRTSSTTHVTGDFEYLPAAGGTPLPVGSNTLTAIFHPKGADANNFEDGIEQTATIIVTKADPVIIWTPTPVPVNTVLGVAQLNASTVGNIAGTFDYGSLVGSSYSTPGNKSVTVTFHPTDLTKYNDGVTLTTTLNVYTVSTTNINPQINWATPADIIYGTAINGVQYNATATLPNTTIIIPGTYTYTSSSPDVIPHVGTYTLTVLFTPTDATKYNNATKSVQIRVKPAAAPLIWNTPTPVPVGTVLGDAQLDASSTLAGNYAYSPDRGTQLNTPGNHNLSVTFTPTNTDYATASAGVTIVVYAVDVTKITPALIWNTPAAINYGTALSAIQLNAVPADAAIAGTPFYSNPGGTILPVGLNKVSVTFTPVDNVHYNPAYAEVTITVNPVQPQITWTKPAAIVYGASLGDDQLNAHSNIAGNFIYSPPRKTILNAGNYTLLATFIPDDKNYPVAGGETTITVNKADPVITWAYPQGISQGKPLTDIQLNASSNVPGNLAYTPDKGTVLAAGNNQILSVTFTPTDGANYNTKTQTVKINVGKLTPVLTWAAPSAITYGTALSDAQLYASANVPGTFTYAQPAGTVLHAGNGQRLTVIFTPTDALNYNSASVSTTINVTKATLIVSANSVTRAFNQPDPTLSVSYSGLVNGDTPDSFLTPVTISTTTSITSLVGTYPITVGGATSNDYAFRFVNGTLTITAIGRDLTFDKLPVKTYGDPDFDASASSTSGEPIIYTSSNSSVATVVNGLIHIVGAGYVTITASLPANPDYNTTPVVSQFMIVNKASQNIEFANIPVQLRGTTYDLSNVKSNSGLPVTFTTNDPMIASINGLTISSLRIGVTGIVANQAGDANYYAANTVVRQIEVVDPNREVIVHPAVSPNGDGINEYLYIEGINEHPDNRVTIINRNGVRVYEITGYNNGTKSFDGRSNFTGARQQAGTYFYLVEYVVNGVGRHLTGYFVLKYD
jgi:gliding motility-associated-like protein